MGEDGLDQYRTDDQAIEGRIIVGAGAAMFLTATGMLLAFLAGGL